MDEKIIIKGIMKDVKGVSMILPIIGVIIYLIVGIRYSMIIDGRTDEIVEFDIAYGFGFGNGINYVLIPLIIVLAIVGFILYQMWSKIQITITDKRVYGNNSIGKRVDLPLDSISAVGTTVFNGLAVTTASGAIKFLFLKNRDEIHEAISNLLIERQNKSKEVAQTVVKQEISQSNADELKKYKDLLDSGVITQEEFDAKKKQLLGL